MSDFAATLQNQGLVTTYFLVFLGGVLTSFTPCIFPMIPITLSILGKHAHARTRLQTFLVSVLYVWGIAVTYSLMGVAAAMTGALFGSFMSHPLVLGFMVLVFFAMSLSLFGLFEIQPPKFIRDKLATDKGSGYSGAFISGVIAGIVASPCVGPILVGILTYVAQTQSPIFGSTLLFTYAIGMGQIFLVLGSFSHGIKLLPKSGPWLDRVKKVMAVMMLLVSFYYLSIIFPALDVSKWNEKKPGFSVNASNWQPYSEAALQQAITDKKPVIVDFYADWCAACKELEKHTFTNQQFQLLANNFVLLKFDATDAESPAFEKMREKYGIVGLPFILFLDSKGEWVKEATLTQFEVAGPFIQRMELVLKSEKK